MTAQEILTLTVKTSDDFSMSLFFFLSTTAIDLHIATKKV